MDAAAFGQVLLGEALALAVFADAPAKLNGGLGGGLLRSGHESNPIRPMRNYPENYRPMRNRPVWSVRTRLAQGSGQPYLSGG